MATAYFKQMTKHFNSHGKSREYSANQAKVHSVAWSCDGRRLASGSCDKTVAVFTLDRDRDRLSKDQTLKGHTDSVDQLCWHPSNPDQFVTASGDKTIRLWDPRTSRSVSTINTKGENINICWSSDGHTIAVGNKEDLVTFIDIRSHKTKEEHFKFEVNEISFNNNSKLFFVTSGFGKIHVLSYPDLKQQHELKPHTGNCICLKFDPTGKNFAIGAADACVSIIDANDFICVRTIDRLQWPVRTLSFSYDGKILASASEDLFVDIAEVETGEKITEVPCLSPTFTAAWHPRRYLLAYACDDKDRDNRDAGTIKLFGLSDT